MGKAATSRTRVFRNRKGSVTCSPEFPEGNGQGSTEVEALESPKQPILLLLEDRREDAAANLGEREKLVPLTLQ